MSQVRKPPLPAGTLYKRTLFAGILLGGLGIVTLLSSNWYMQSAGLAWLNSGNPVASFVAQVYGFVMAACIPFSAALVSAALVMKYLDYRLETSTQPGGSQPGADRNGT